MVDSTSPFLFPAVVEFPPDNGGPKSLDSLDHAVAWAKEQIASTAWLTRIPVDSPLRARADSLREALARRFRELDAAAKRATAVVKPGQPSSPVAEKRLGEVAKCLQAIQAAGRNIIVVGSVREKVVQAAQQSGNDLALAVAEVLWIGGAIPNDSSAGQLQLMLSQASQANEQLMALKADLAKEELAVRMISERVNQAEREAINAAVEAARADITGLIQQTEATLKAMRDNYSTALGLDQPRKYWAERARTQRLSAQGWGISALAVAVVGAVILVALVAGWLGPKLMESSSAPKYWTIGVASFLTFSYVWLVRVLVRNFLSHRHLAEDADLRLTSVESFLALMSTKGFQQSPDAMRALLDAMLRPSQVGLVPGEQVPVTPHSVLHNVIDQTNQ